MPAFGDLPVGTLFYRQDHVGRWALYLKTSLYRSLPNSCKIEEGTRSLFENWVECDTKLRIKDEELILSEPAHPTIKEFLDKYCANMADNYWIIGAKIEDQELHVRLRSNAPTQIASKLPKTFNGFEVVLDQR